MNPEDTPKPCLLSEAKDPYTQHTFSESRDPQTSPRLRYDSFGMTAIKTSLTDFFAPIFQRLLNYDHELIGECAVDDAVIIAQR